MLTENISKELDISTIETLDSYISKEDNYCISHKARYTGFKHRSKVEFLRFFIV